MEYLCSPTSIIRLRGNDPTGHGYYGAKRGSRKHKGTDYIAEPGENILACTYGKVRIGQVYSWSKEMKLVEITHSGVKVQQMYINPCVNNGDTVIKGEVIGCSQDISSFHGGNMINHCHISVWKNGLLTDPEPIIKPL